MFRFLAKVSAKLAYRFKLEKEAATNDLNAGGRRMTYDEYKISESVPGKPQMRTGM